MQPFQVSGRFSAAMVADVGYDEDLCTLSDCMTDPVILFILIIHS